MVIPTQMQSLVGLIARIEGTFAMASIHGKVLRRDFGMLVILLAANLAAGEAAARQWSTTWTAYTKSAVLLSRQGTTPNNAAENAVAAIGEFVLCEVSSSNYYAYLRAGGLYFTFYQLSNGSEHHCEASYQIHGSVAGGPNYIEASSTTDCELTSSCTRKSPKNLGPGHCPLVGNPINIATGNKIQVETDSLDVTPGRLDMVRYYNSRAEISTRIGPKWTSTFDRSLRVVGSGIVLSTRPDGRIHEHVFSGGQWKADSDVSELLEQPAGPGTSWRLTDLLADAVEDYDPDGRLASITLPSGVVQSMTYSDGTASGPNGAVIHGSTTPLPAGHLIRVQDSFARRLVFTYDQNGWLAGMTDTAGGEFLYGRDLTGSLISVQYPGGAIKRYHYNESANTSGANLPGSLTGITDENNIRYATFRYDSTGRAISTEHAGGRSHTRLLTPPH